MAEKALLILDGDTMVLVDAEKMLLCREVFKHYTQRWQEACASGETPLASEVASMLKKLSVPHEIISGSDHVCTMSILSSTTSAPVA